MTTFQDPQPQSRRAMRASERGDAVEPTPEFPTNSATDQPTPFIEPVPLVEPEVRAPQYSSPLPSFDAGQFRSRADARENPPFAATQALPQVEQPSYRPRGYVPPASAPAEPSPFVSQPVPETVAAAEPPAAESVHAFEAPAAEHTLTRRELRALRESGVQPDDAPAVAPVQNLQQAPASQAAAPSEPIVAPVDWDQPVAAAPFASAAAPVATPRDASDFASLFDQPAEKIAEPIVAPVDSAPVASSEAQAWPFGGLLTPTSEQAPATEVAEDVAPAAVEAGDAASTESTSSSPFSFFRRSKRAAQEPATPEAVIDEPAFVEPVVAEPPVLVEPVAQEPVVVGEVIEAEVVAPEAVAAGPMPTEHASAAQDATPGLSPFDALFTPKSAGTDAMPATQAWSAPVGHWSTQADLDDESQPYENTINRTVGTSSSATNALVLPSIPVGSDIRGPLTETGQITLTGSIDLSHALSSTGATDRLENTGMDALFELHDAEAISTDSAPVRAIRAVSTHNTGHGVTHTQKPKGNRALTGLLIAASSMAVVVAGLLVAALAFNLF